MVHTSGAPESRSNKSFIRRLIEGEQLNKKEDIMFQEEVQKEFEKESKEHPELPSKVVWRIATDHISKKYYG